MLITCFENEYLQQYYFQYTLSLNERNAETKFPVRVHNQLRNREIYHLLLQRFLYNINSNTGVHSGDRQRTSVHPLTTTVNHHRNLRVLMSSNVVTRTLKPHKNL